jgi:hypothetical protein
MDINHFAFGWAGRVFLIAGFSLVAEPSVRAFEAKRATGGLRA